MPSHKPTKTYAKRTRSQHSESAKVFNALLAENLTKRLKSRRKKATVELKELPPRVQEYLTDESLKVSPNNTFDKLLKGNVYNEVRKVANFVKIQSSESEASTHVSVSIHSPIVTRRKRPKVVVTKVPEPPPKRNSTFDKPVTCSLSIEKENQNKKDYSSLSYIKLPQIKENEVSNNNLRIFSDTFRERHTVHSSTPCVTAPVRKIIGDPISPITKADSSKLWKKSIEEIQKWDEEFPKLETLLHSKKTGTQDWKLNCQPKVYLRQSDIITRSRSKRNSDFKGFSAEEQTSSSQIANLTKSSMRELDQDLTDLSQRQAKILSRVWATPPRIRTRSLAKKSLGKKPARTVQIKATVTKRSSRINSKTSLPLTRITSTPSKDSRPTPTKRLSRKSQPLTPPLPLRRISKRISNTPQEKKAGSRFSLRRISKRISGNSQKKSRPTSPKKLRISTPPKAGPSFPLRRISKRTSGSSQEKSRPTSPKQLRVLTPPKVSSPFPLKRISKRKRISKKISESPQGKSRPTPLKKLQILTPPKVCSRPLRRTSKWATSTPQEKLRPTTPKRNTQLPTPPRMLLRSKRKVLSPKKTTSKRKRSNNFVSTRTRSKYNIKENGVDEKEKSCSDSNDDFSTPLKLNDLAEETVALPKKGNLTADLNAFDDFSRSHFSRIQVPDSPVVLLSDDSFLSEANRIKIERKSSRNTGLDYVITPRKSTPNNNTSKITILSNIILSAGKSPEMIKTCRNVLHDHSYSNSPSKLSDIIESSVVDSNNPTPRVTKSVTVRRKLKPIQLKPGKSYRRSLSLLRRKSVTIPERVLDVCQSDCGCFKCLLRTKINSTTFGRRSLVVPAARKSLGDTILESYARKSVGYVQQEEKYINDLDDSVRSLSLDSRGSLSPNLQIVTAKDVVLRRCGQTDVLPFEQCYPQSALQHCQKIGEGVYGEVFLYRNPNGGTSVMKVIPIEGDLMVNGEKQKKFEEILSEIVIAMELSNLRNDKKNTTTSFSQVQNVKCVQGCYPERLLDLWELYDETRGSENDSPQMFPHHQQYIVLELANGGDALESYVFTNAQQAYAMFKQTACALAVAESQLKFEHRDLHWGNILINTVDKSKVLRFRLNGKEIEVETYGIEATIIDFTLSRIEFDGVVIFNDLSLDNELFVAKGDYQFEIYRLMQKANGNMWQQFEPYTNILWLHYVLDKAVSSALRYKNPRSKVHNEYMTKLKKVKDEILAFPSVGEFVKKNF